MLTRRNLLIGACCVLLLSFVAAAIAHSVFGGGAVVVRIHEASGEPTIGLTLPGDLAHVALCLLPDRLFADCDTGGDCWLPVAREALHSLAGSPDFTLVRIESRDEDVEILVSAGSLVVLVKDNGDSVHVRVPLRLANAVLSKIERARSAGPEPASPASS